MQVSVMRDAGFRLTQSSADAQKAGKMMTGECNTPNRSRRPRRGSSCVFVLFSAMFITSVGLSGLTVSRLMARTDESANVGIEAISYARSAIELGCKMIRDDPNWRINLGSTTWISAQAIGDGTLNLTATIVNDDADADPYNDDVTFVGMGVCYDSVHKTQVTLKDGKAFEPGTWARKVD